MAAASERILRVWNNDIAFGSTRCCFKTERCRHFRENFKKQIGSQVFQADALEKILWIVLHLAWSFYFEYSSFFFFFDRSPLIIPNSLYYQLGEQKLWLVMISRPIFEVMRWCFDLYLGGEPILLLRNPQQQNNKNTLADLRREP